MKRKRGNVPTYLPEIVFRPAITPLEAAVLPALEKPARGALSMIRTAYDAGREKRFCGRCAYRAKIWVR